MTDKNINDLAVTTTAATTDRLIGRAGANTEDTSFTLAVINTALQTQGRKYPTRVVTAAGAVTVTIADYYIGVNKTTGAATVVNLPIGVNGMAFVIKDEKLDAATNNITITPASGNIVGTARASTFVMNANGQSIMIIYNGTEWIVTSAS